MSGLKKNTTNIILSVVAVILIIAFGIVLFFDNKEQQAAYAKNMEINSQTEVERREKMIELEAREQTDSFYQKLVDGFDVNILIIGDSISLGTGASEQGLSWIDLMETYLVNTYNVNVKTKNVSLEGSTCYAGYVRTMAIDDEAEYDLAIICYGQNDDDKYFGVFYEGLLRAVRSKNEKCSIISILESSQKKYTEKMAAIQELSQHYGSQIADTIKPFTDKSNGEYKSLTDDGINPNDAGQQIYADVITGVIDEEAAKGTPYNDEDVELINQWAKNLNKFKGITAKEFKRTDNKYVYTLDEPLTGVFGIDYKYLSGENGCKIFIDGTEYKAPEATEKNDSLQLYILVVRNQPISAKKSIEIRFSSEEQANAFKGVCVSWE